MIFYLTGITHVIWKVVFHFMMLIDIFSTKTVKCKVDDRTEAIKAIKADPVRININSQRRLLTVFIYHLIIIYYC